MHSNHTLLSVSISLIVAVGCGGRDSAASKSAAEFDREQQNGGSPPPAGGAHGGHRSGQESSADGTEAQNDDPMAGMDHSNMPGMKPAKGATPAVDPMAGMDHSNMPGMKPAKGAAPAVDPMAGMDHSNMPGMQPTKGAAPASGSMAGMDHSTMPGMTMAPPVPEPAAVTAQPGQPAATLRLGDLDGPAPTSVRDAGRSAAMAQEMAGGHAMSHGTYSQTDAGRADAPPAAHGDTKPAGALGASTADPHAGHRKPAPKPKPSPAPKENR